MRSTPTQTCCDARQRRVTAGVSADTWALRAAAADGTNVAFPTFLDRWRFSVFFTSRTFICLRHTITAMASVNLLLMHLRIVNKCFSNKVEMYKEKIVYTTR